MSAKLALIRASDGVEWRPDAVFNPRVVDRSLITAHPIEDAETVVDHTQRAPIEVSFVAAISPTPNGAKRNDTGLAVGAGGSGGDYVATMVEWIRAAKNNGDVVLVSYDRSQIGGDYLIANCSRTFGSSNQATDIAVSLVEARFARSQTQVVGPEYGPLIVPATASGFASTNNGGDAPTEPVDDDEAEKIEKQSSIAASLADSLAAAFGGE